MARSSSEDSGRAVRAAGEAGPEYAPKGRTATDKQDKLSLPWRFNTGSQLDDEGAQADECNANDPEYNDAALEQLVRDVGTAGMRYGAGEDEAVRPGEAQGYE